MASTRKTCLPRESRRRVIGESHGAAGCESSLHLKVEPGSFDLNLKVGVRSLVLPLGAAVIVVSGRVVSIVQASVAGVGSVLPTWSVAWTEKVCWPSASGPSRSGLVQSARGPSSIEHWKVEFGSLEENLIFGVVPLLNGPGERSS